METEVTEEILRVTGDLVRFRTTEDRPDELSACCSYAEEYFGDSGLAVERYDWADKPSLVVSATGGLEPKLMLNGHLDVVAAEDAQYEPRVDGDRIYGRGTSDMKGAVAVMMVLLRRLARAGVNKSVALMLNGDEEIGGYDGAKRLMEAGWCPGFFLAGEPTFNRIGTEAKGILRLRLTFRGRAAHGARPWEGKSAILACLESLGGMKSRFDPERARDDWITSYTPTLIDGGDVINKVPDRCRATIDIRFVPDDDPEKIADLIARESGADEVERLLLEAPAHCPPDHPGVIELGRGVKAVTGREAEIIRKNEGSDARFFAAAGIGAVVFGPAGGGWHGPEEWMSVGQMQEFYRILDHLVRGLPDE